MPKLLDLITPGDVLYEEFMKPLNISQNQLARDIDVPPSRVHAIVHGKRTHSNVDILHKPYADAAAST
ncbi:MAG: addiction module antidote protein, HigA family [Rickettsia endosymbiont of Oxypoda opaca]|nr:addiction module antidote protein, HigA family [Rickettsia endosymbiont of Oxypoda opaca]